MTFRNPYDTDPRLPWPRPDSREDIAQAYAYPFCGTGICEACGEENVGLWHIENDTIDIGQICNRCLHDYPDDVADAILARREAKDVL